MPERPVPLASKTVRPGGLGGFSYYASDRHPRTAPQPSRKTNKKPLIVVVLLIVLGGVLFHPSDTKTAPVTSTTQKQTATQPQKKAAPAAQTATVNNCAGNTSSKFISISISQRHLWACEGTKTVYDSPVITGMEQHAATLTPPGTYKIQAKQKDTVLTGSDETGSWRDPVSYWMPWLSNEYGTYGFHDATWRDNSAFGKVDPNSSDASHGCVELPLKTAAWVYDWAPVGTSLTVKA